MNKGNYVYTIYKDPTDPTDSFLVRRWELDLGVDGVREAIDLGVFAGSPSLEGARNFIPSSSRLLPRNFESLPTIETWV